MQPNSLPAPARRTRARRAARRATIVEGARKCFQEMGYNLATVEDVLRYASISRGTFYSYFTSKSSVLIAIVESVEVELIDMYAELGPLSRVSRSDMEAWLDKLLRFFGEHPDVLQIWSSAVHDADFLVFLQSLGNRMAEKMGLRSIELTASPKRETMFTALFLSQIGQFCSIVTLSPWSGQRERAVALMSEILYRSFITMAHEDAGLAPGGEARD